MSVRLFRMFIVLAVVVGCFTAFLPSAASAALRGADLTVLASRTHESVREILVFGARGRALPSFGGAAGVSRADRLTWSPDGREYAFVDPGIDLPELMVARPGDLEPRPLAEPAYGDDPIFDPGGDVIFSTIEWFDSSSASAKGSEAGYGSTLWAAPTDGSEPRRIASFGPRVSAHPFSSASDGTLALEVSTPRGAGIAILPPHGSTLHWVVAPGHGENGSPAISPDGSEVVYLRDRLVGRFPPGPRLVSTKLMSVSTRGGRPEVLATIPGGARWPSWDPSGSRLSFTALGRRQPEGSSAHGPHNALMEMNPDGSCLTTIYAASDGGIVWGGSWRPGADRVLGPISC